MRATHLKSVQKENRATVLNFIRQSAPVSRQDIARGLGLSPTTVSSAVSYLILQNFVHETGAGPSSGGRPPVFLDIQPDGGIILAVDMYSALPNRILRAAALDLKGNILLFVEHKMDIVGNAELEKAILDCLQALLDKLGLDQEKIIAFGVSVPGIVDLKNGLVTATKIDVKNFALQKLLTEKFGLPVVIQNSEDIAALGEYYFGVGGDVSSLFFLSVGYGVGAGMVIDGKIFPNRRLSAGEIGHVTVLPNGPLCHCGNHGCLSALIGSEKILERMTEVINVDKNHVLGEYFKDDDSLNIPHILEVAAQGDEFTSNLVKDAAEWLGIAVANIVNLLNPEIIIFDGDLLDPADFFLDLVKEEVSKHSFGEYFAQTQFQHSLLGRNAGLRGIGVLALDKLLENL